SRPAACSETFACPPRTRSGNSASRSPSTSVARPLPRAAMWSCPPALAALLATRLRADRIRREIDQAGSRLACERLLGLLQRDRSRIALRAKRSTPCRRSAVGLWLVAARELLPLRELRLALLPDREDRCGDEDRRVGTGG